MDCIDLKNYKCINSLQVLCCIKVNMYINKKQNIKQLDVIPHKVKKKLHIGENNIYCDVGNSEPFFKIYPNHISFDEKNNLGSCIYAVLRLFETESNYDWYLLTVSVSQWDNFVLELSILDHVYVVPYWCLCNADKEMCKHMIIMIERGINLSKLSNFIERKIYYNLIKFIHRVSDLPYRERKGHFCIRRKLSDKDRIAVDVTVHSHDRLFDKLLQETKCKQYFDTYHGGEFIVAAKDIDQQFYYEYLPLTIHFPFGKVKITNDTSIVTQTKGPCLSCRLKPKEIRNMGGRDKIEIPGFYDDIGNNKPFFELYHGHIIYDEYSGLESCMFAMFHLFEKNHHDFYYVTVSVSEWNDFVRELTTLDDAYVAPYWCLCDLRNEYDRHMIIMVEKNKIYFKNFTKILIGTCDFLKEIIYNMSRSFNECFFRNSDTNLYLSKRNTHFWRRRELHYPHMNLFVNVLYGDGYKQYNPHIRRECYLPVTLYAYNRKCFYK